MAIVRQRAVFAPGCLLKMGSGLINGSQAESGLRWHGYGHCAADGLRARSWLRTGRSWSRGDNLTVRRVSWRLCQVSL